MIELHDFSIGYGERTLLCEVEATIEKGKLTALIGRNGTGKSTLLRAIAGLNHRYAGRILLDGLFAAVAAIGFGAISDPPMRAFPRIALLAAIGHALRFTLMHCSALDIATASLFAAFAIGMGSLWLGRGVRCPMTCLYIPALLPMVPGIYAYKTVFSLIMFLQSLDRADEGMRYMQQFFLNATVSLSVIALLAAGATLPIFIFKRRAFSMTRRTRKNS